MRKRTYLKFPELFGLGIGVRSSYHSTGNKTKTYAGARRERERESVRRSFLSEDDFLLLFLLLARAIRSFSFDLLLVGNFSLALDFFFFPPLH